jgi:hypothetical protein
MLFYSNGQKNWSILNKLDQIGLKNNNNDNALGLYKKSRTCDLAHDLFVLDLI